VSWIAGTADPWHELLASRPRLAELYGNFYRSLWNGAVDRRVLELCRLRIAAIHDCAAERDIRDAAVSLSAAERTALDSGDPAPFDAASRAALALAERMPFDHHGITDQEVATAERHFGADGTVTLLTALAFFDVTCRLKLVADTEVVPTRLERPPLDGDRLV